MKVIALIAIMVSISSSSNNYLDCSSQCIQKLPIQRGSSLRWKWQKKYLVWTPSWISCWTERWILGNWLLSNCRYCCCRFPSRTGFLREHRLKCYSTILWREYSLDLLRKHECCMCCSSPSPATQCENPDFLRSRWSPLHSSLLPSGGFLRGISECHRF